MAGTLSGGEQQMLAIGRALTGAPKFLMLDEPSLGIAPLLIKTIFEKIVEINRELGMTILLVEQNANLALGNFGQWLRVGDRPDYLAGHVRGVTAESPSARGVSWPVRKRLPVIATALRRRVCRSSTCPQHRHGDGAPWLQPEDISTINPAD